MPRFPAGQTLLIDADDTLWENNIYFERAIAAFISFLDHHEYSPEEVRQTLNAVERETILAHGYGLSSFKRSLVECFERLSPASVTEENRERIRKFAPSIADQEIEKHRSRKHQCIRTKKTYFHLEDQPSATAEAIAGTGWSGSASASSA